MTPSHLSSPHQIPVQQQQFGCVVKQLHQDRALNYRQHIYVCQMEEDQRWRGVGARVHVHPDKLSGGQPQEEGDPIAALLQLPVRPVDTC